MSTIYFNFKKTNLWGDWLKNTRNGVTVFYTKCHYNQNPARAKENKAHNLNQRAHQPLVITIDILSGTSNYTQKQPKTQINTKIK